MISKRFNDFDAFAATVRDVDCTMLLNNVEHYEWNIYQSKIADLEIQFGQVGSGNIVEGQSWSNGYLFYLPLTAKAKYLANGSVIEKKALAILEPECEFCISTKAAHDWCSIFVPRNKFFPGGDFRDLSIALSAAKTPTCYVTSPNSKIALKFLSAVAQIIIASKNVPRFESSPAAECAAENLSRIAATLVGKDLVDGPRQTGRPKVPRGEIIQSCKDLFEERTGGSILVSEMAANAGVSERTLRTAFKEYLGMGPVRYLKMRQLNLIRRALHNASPGSVSVSDVLIDHGVWEFGRFASQYRYMFGELPSETLHNAKV